MGKRDIHQKPFDDGTCKKLDLFQSYLREWLPVFINTKGIDAIQIFDLFAGPGRDLKNVPGSPMLICEELLRLENELRPNHLKGIRVFFNEYDKGKYSQLNQNLECFRELMPTVQFSITQLEFKKVIPGYIENMRGPVANLVFLDQNGVSQITQDIFLSLVQLHRTDLLFFISSSIVNRFGTLPEIRQYVPVTEDDLAIINGNNVHRVLSNAYPRWLPRALTYYLGSFSIKKGPNVYGLIFGSGHPLGIEKFLQVIWRQGGDANFDVDGDRIDTTKPCLFPEMDTPTRIRLFEEELKKGFLERQFQTNFDIFKFRLQAGFLDRHVQAGLAKVFSDGIIPKQRLSTTYTTWKAGGEVSIVYPKGRA